ncbi:hypothetical protein [Stappia phage SI01]|uniref:Scaffolding protein n=1 Tax=Stappia phage SI01 TaxID=2847766 RepID=A0AAE7VIG4_9CAUD|nr:hypothetical protein [Stappia phage SI01]
MVVKAGETQGAGAEDLSDGQSDGAGAPVAPKVVNTGAGGDGILPVEKKAEEPQDEQTPPADAAADTGDEADAPEENTPPLTEWVEFDDPSASAAIELLKEAGVTPAEASSIFDKAVQSGDLRDIDRKALEAKVGRAKAQLIMNGVHDYHTRTTETNQKTVQTVHEIFGGESGWNTVRDWAQVREKTDPAFKSELDSIRADLNAGGRAAKAAAMDLLTLYNGAPSTKGLGTKTATLKTGSGKPGTAPPLSRAEYVEALKEAHSKGASADAIALLSRRRAAGRKAGI